jgi:hypothetical protein
MRCADGSTVREGNHRERRLAEGGPLPDDVTDRLSWMFPLYVFHHDILSSDWKLVATVMTLQNIAIYFVEVFLPVVV